MKRLLTVALFLVAAAVIIWAGWGESYNDPNPVPFVEGVSDD